MKLCPFMNLDNESVRSGLAWEFKTLSKSALKYSGLKQHTYILGMDPCIKFIGSKESNNKTKHCKSIFPPPARR